MRERKSGLELLRIISILMIICIHAFGLLLDVKISPIGMKTTFFINSVCNIGVSCFVLISGYFGVKRDFRKILRLELMVIFFSLCTTAVLAAAFPETYRGGELFELLIKSCIPVISRKHWFYTCYICLLLFSPWLNDALDRMTKRQHEGLLLTMFILFSVCPSFFYFEIMQDGGKGLMNMVLMYVMGRYIRKYADFMMERWKGCAVFAVLAAICYFSITHQISIGGIRHSFTKDNSIVNVGMSVVLLYLFKDMKWHSKAVNRIAVDIFGIYILNVPVLQLLHAFVFRMGDGKLETNWFPVWMALETMAAFLIGLAVDIVRKLLLGKVEDKIVNTGINVCDRLGAERMRKVGKKMIGFFERKEDRLV